MKIRIVEKDYIDYIYNYFNGNIQYPIKNNGFNLSFCKFKNQYIFVFRNVFPLKNILLKKDLIPGISSKFLDKIKNNFTININTNLSEDFIWDWSNFYESNILFVGTINDELKININKNINPYSIVNPKYNIKYFKKNKLEYFPARIPSEDYRLYNFNNRIYLIDSATNTIKQIIIENNKIKIFTKYDDICNFSIAKKINDNTNQYYKIFEKNWSLYNVNFDKNKEVLFSFLHDFTIDGIEGIQYNPQTQKCFKSLLVPYKKETFPINKKIRFSFGSTCIYIKYENKKGYLGMGHLKNEIIDKKEIKNLTESEKYYYNMFINNNNTYKKIFKNKYKVHPSRQYYAFFFLYDDINKKFYISDPWLPIPYYNYFFSLVFPMSVVRDKDDVLLSMGYGDYTNIILKYSIKNIVNELKYNISEPDFNITKLKLKIINL